MNKKIVKIIEFFTFVENNENGYFMIKMNFRISNFYYNDNNFDPPTLRLRRGLDGFLQNYYLNYKWV